MSHPKHERRQTKAFAKPSTANRRETAKLRRTLSAALAHHRAGRFDKAEASYRTILAADPQNADAQHLLGVLAYQCGKLAPALQLIHAALPALADLPDAHVNYGNILRDLGRLHEAAASYRRAVALDAANGMAHNNLARALIDQGDFEEGLTNARRAAELMPGFVPAYVNCAGALLGLRRFEDAETAIRRALAIDPTLFRLHLDLGYALQAQKRVDDAIDAFRHVTDQHPHLPEGHNNLGNALNEKGRRDEAIAAYQVALRLAPTNAEIHYNLGKALRDRGLFEEAIASFKTAVTHRPNFASAWHELGNLLADRQSLADASVALARAAPHIPDAFIELVWTRRRMCDWNGYAEAEAQARRLSGTQVFALMNLQSTMAEQREWAGRAAERLQVPFSSRFPPPKPRRRDRLRIGYVSANFRTHAGAFLIAGLIEAHDCEAFEVVGYSAGPDDGGETRARLARAFDRFVDIKDLGDFDAASLVRRDEIDILVDLDGHTKAGRIAMFAYRPAPIQATYLGYPGTTGADFIDYLLADAVVVPPDQQTMFSEQVVYLPHSYQVNDDRRQIAAQTPSREECGLAPDSFVFCCLNNPSKITPGVFASWMRILTACPGGVLWLLGGNHWVTANLTREAVTCGVDPARIIFAPMLPPAEHLARHRLADLFLDTLPYNAHTSASDALWAGLPVITCAGTTFAGRVAASLLRAVGLPELVTSSAGDYETLACSLYQDRTLLSRLRARLARNRVTAPLFDTRRFARHLEAAYRQMWAQWVSGRRVASFSVASQDLPSEEPICRDRTSLRGH